MYDLNHNKISYTLLVMSWTQRSILTILSYATSDHIDWHKDLMS
jgi:hypothetical protein